MTDACLTCPFRAGSAMAYDADAHDALADGCEPSCHDAVGFDRVFAHAAHAPAPCRGYQAYMDGQPGYALPRASTR